MRFLVIRYSGLGDLVMFLPTLEKLKAQYPNSSITLLTDASNRDFYKLSGGLIDDTITVNRKFFREKRFFRALNELVSLGFKIRRCYDIVIDFQSFGETATISYLTNAREKWGAEKKSKYNYGYTHLVPYDTSGHRSQLFARIAHVDDTLSYPRIVLSTAARLYAEQISRKLDPAKPTVGLNIGSTNERRRWSEQNFSALGSQLADRYNILVFIGPLEQRFKEAFKSFTTVKNTTLEELTGAISVCSYFISNDTGPVHIAAALDVPTLTLFSTGEDADVGCLNKHKQFIHHDDINSITLSDVTTVFQRLTNA